MNFLNGLILFGAIFSTSHGYKILAVFPIPMYSHYGINSRIVNELAKRGHEVTMVTPFLQKSVRKNVKEVSIESIKDVFNEQKKLLADLETKTIFEHAQFMSSMGYILSEKTLQHENVQKLLHSDEKYDVVLTVQFLNEALMGIAQHFKAPLVLVATMQLFPWANYYLGHPTPPSYVPHVLTPYNGHMHFWQRLLNSIHDSYSILYHQWVMLPKHRELVKNYIPGELDLYDFLNNASLLLMNSHVSTCDALPRVPNAIEIGGVHIEEPKPLPSDLQQFMDESKNGVVVFSLGSNLKSSDLPPDTRDVILKALSELKENVLWKWEAEELPGQPKNVKLKQWLPLNDVLAHPNVKAFITHGGLLSTMESIYHGVPTLGIPFFSDQKMNMAVAASHGYAVVVPFQEIDKEKLSSALDQILNNPKYRENAKKRSQIMRDRPLKPIDTAMYWIEYVVRHQGAPHLRYPGLDLAWHERNLLDVIAFILGSIYFIYYYVIGSIMKRYFKKNSRVGRRKKNN